MGLKVGDEAPPFELPDTAGKKHSVGEPNPDVRATVVYWTCNHCPYALAWHPRLNTLAADDHDGNVAFYAINSNDGKKYPDDSLAAMKKRVKAEGDWSHPYLFDESQEVARAFGAAKTPEVFIFDEDMRLRYRGAPDADYEDPSQDAAFLRAAIDDLLAGRRVEMSSSDAVGCTIKWK